ncbi:MAG: toll/interleukin-1 receptor domain-containing protein [Terriglobia bacterium]
MAKRAHLKILDQGVTVWNQWRAENPAITPDLEDATLIDYLLQGADLSGAKLSFAGMQMANMQGAVLKWADLSATDLRDADLTAADLTGADLHMANLRGTCFQSSNWTNARISFTIFGKNDLSVVQGLETVRHRGPSTIGIDTIYESKGNIPEVFLRGCGVPEDFIVYMRSLVGKPIDYYSCFISYSSQDDDFAQRLYADLQAKNVRCWKFDENAKWGEPVWGEIDTAVRHYDKLVVICSEHSLQSPPVIREIERALQKEDREHRNVLFPIRIDDYLFDEWEHPRKADVVSKVIGDFRGSDNLATYAKAFPRFLDALNRPQQATKDT